MRRQHVNQASISLERLRDTEIALPPLPEQRAIAWSLQVLQHAIRTRRRELALECERKAALMQHLFTHGTHGEPRKQTEIGEMPESWQVVQFGEACQFLQYGTSDYCDMDATGIPVLRIPNIINGKIDMNDLKFIHASSTLIDRLRLSVGDLLFVRTNGRREYTGRCAMFNGELDRALFASYLIRARLKPGFLLPEYVQFYTMTSRGRGYLSGRASNAADGKFNINTQTIRSMLVLVPTIDAERASILARPFPRSGGPASPPCRG